MRFILVVVFGLIVSPSAARVLIEDPDFKLVVIDGEWCEESVYAEISRPSGEAIDQRDVPRVVAAANFVIQFDCPAARRLALVGLGGGSALWRRTVDLEALAVTGAAAAMEDDRIPIQRPRRIREIQGLLNALGYDAGPSDGLFGRRTSAAIRAFEQAAGRAPAGRATASVVLALRRATAAPIRTTAPEALASARNQGLAPTPVEKEPSVTAAPKEVDRAAAKRVALIVAVDDYERLDPLANPVDDAERLERLLLAHDYQTLTAHNVDAARFASVIDEFAELSQGASEAFVYFSGHGLSVRANGADVNALMPSDASFDCSTRTASNFVRIEDILAKLTHVPKQTALFDACREDPVPKCPAPGLGQIGQFAVAANLDDVAASLDAAPTRGLSPSGGSQGLAAAPSVIIGYSAAIGGLALDGRPGEHSPYAAALFAELEGAPRKPFSEALFATAERVARATRGYQTPALQISGGAPEMCLAGGICETSEVVRRQRVREQARRLAKLSKDALAEGDAATALALALEAVPPRPGARAREAFPEAMLALEKSFLHLDTRGVLTDHSAPINAIAVHPSNRVLATSSADDQVTLWRSGDSWRPETLRSGQGGGSHNPDIAFSANGESLIAFTQLEHDLTIWRTQDGRRLLRLGGVKAAHVSRKHDLLAVILDDGTAQIRVASTGAMRAEHRGALELDGFPEVALQRFTRDGDGFLLGYRNISDPEKSGVVRLDAARAGAPPRRFIGTPYDYSEVDDALLTGARERLIVWDVGSGEKRRETEWTPAASPFGFTALAPNSTDVVYEAHEPGLDRRGKTSIEVYRSDETSKFDGRVGLLRRFGVQDHAAPFVGGSLLVWLWDGSLSFIDHQRWAESGRTKTSFRHGANYAVSDLGFIAAYQPEMEPARLVEIYDVARGALVNKIQLPTDGAGLSTAEFLHGGLTLAVGLKDGSVLLYDVRREDQAVSGLPDGHVAASRSTNRRLVLTDRGAELREAATGAVLQRIDGKTLAAGYSPDRKYVYVLNRIINEKDELVVWRLADGAETLRRPETVRPIEAVEFSLDSRLLVAAQYVDKSRSSVRLMVSDPATGAELARPTLPAMFHHLGSAARFGSRGRPVSSREEFSAGAGVLGGDGEHLFAFSQDLGMQRISVWSGDVVGSLGLPIGDAASLAFDRAQRVLAARFRGDGGLRTFDVANASPLAMIPFEAASIRMSPDGRFLAAAPNGLGRLTVFETRTGRAVFEVGASPGVQQHRAPVFYEFSEDGSVFVAMLAQGYAEFWEMESEELLSSGVLDLEGSSDFSISADGEVFSVLKQTAGAAANHWEIRSLERIVSQSWRERYERLDPGTLVEQARAAAPRCLSSEQRKRFGLAGGPPLWCLEPPKPPYRR